MLVSVLMITYNHEQYIVQAIEGVLMQQTNFDVELIIGNDFSSDSSNNIINNFISSHKHSKDIKYFFHDYNLGIQDNFKFIKAKANGKYIAICEGDDFWTDPLKLQKQIDFLEVNMGYSLCYTRFKTLNQKTKELALDFNQKYFQNKEEWIDFDFEQFQKGWHIGNQTLVFRNSFFNIGALNKFKFFKDVHVVAHLLKKGKGACLNFVGATYRIHDGGIHTSVTVYKGFEIGYNAHQEIYFDNKKNIFLKRKYIHSLKNYVNANIRDYQLMKAFELSIKLFFVDWSISNLLRHIKRIFLRVFK